MSFRDCIAKSAEIGMLSQGKADEAIAAYDQAVQEGLDAGLSEAAANAHAPDAAMKAISTAVFAKRKERIAQMRATARLHNRITGTTTPFRATTSVLDDIMDEVYLTYRSTSGQLMATINQVLDTFSPKLAGIITPVKHMDNVIRELYGEKTGDEAAAQMSEAVKKVLDQSRKMINLEGASVPENPNFRFPQTHDRFIVRQATKQQWVDEHLADEVLDWEIMEYEGKKIPVDKRREILEKVYDAIITEGNNKIRPGMPDNSTLAARLSRDRFLYYKSGEAWLTMQKKYGTGNFYHQLVEQIDTTSRTISLMRSFGPNTQAGKQFAERTVKAHTAELQKQGKGTNLEVRRDKALDRFDGQYKIHTRDVNTGQGDVITQTINTSFSILNTALLGGAVVSNLFGDLALGSWVRNINKMPSWHVIPAYLSAIGNNKAFRKQMVDDGIILESAISQAYEAQRYNVALEGNHIARKLSEVNYRLQGANMITQVGRGVAGADLQKTLARVRDMAFDDIPFAAQMRNLGITARDWELVRGTEFYSPEYYSFGRAKFLRPIDMYKAAETEEARKAAEKFLNLQEMFVRDLVPGPTMRARYALGNQIPIGWAQTLLKSAGQLMLFPASVMFNHWRMIPAAPNWPSRIWRAGTFFAYTTVAGAMIAQVKDLLMGKEPTSAENMLTPEFITRAAMLGGGGAIVGDFLYDNFFSANDYYAAGTPSDDQWAKGRKLIKAAWGEAHDPQTDNHLGKAAVDFAWGLVPKPVPYKLFMERMIRDPILEATDPAAYQNKIAAEQQRETEEERGSWWGTGD